MQIGTQLYIYQQRSIEELGRPFDAALDTILAQIREAGYEGVEMPLALCGTPASAEHTGNLLTEYGLQLASAYASGPVHDDRAEDTIWSVLDQASEAKRVGMRSLTFNPAPAAGRRKSDDELHRQAHFLDLLGGQLLGRGLTLAVHFHGADLQEGGRELWSNLGATANTNVGLCLDVDWAWRGGVEPLQILDRYGARLVSLHVRDAKAGRWAQALGEGDYNYAPIVERLRRLQFDGWVNVELAYETGMTWTRSVAENLRLSRDWLKQALGE